MNSHERDIIRGVHPASSNYIEAIGPVMKFGDNAFIGGDTPFQQIQTTLRIDKTRQASLGKAITTDGLEKFETSYYNDMISELFLQYDDSTTTEFIPIADVILEYRAKPDDGGTVRETTGVALCMGIPMETVGTIENLLTGALSGSARSFFFPIICDSHNGHR